MSSPDKYQRHIDGLRAVAVLSVIFYHFGQTTFSGGFVGVDVFFVISGYLISNLILVEIGETGDFDFKRFYIRRMRRLFPAMAVTLAVSLAVAVALLSPARLMAFGQSLWAAIFSVSNITFWLESGYFDQASHSKPLLHTWSLGVEEQFYLLWPALLWLAARSRCAHSQLYVLAAVGAGSFALNLLWVWGKFDDDYSSTIFFLTPFRIFELVIGALAIFLARHYPARRSFQEAGMLLGLGMIAYSVIAFEDGMVFPSYHALIPCVGALLVIMSRQAVLVGWLLTNRLSVGIGLISYSMYLIHWPVVVFYQYYKFAPPGQADYLALFFLTVLLSVMMYFFVEKVFRKNAPSLTRTIPQKIFVIPTLGLMCSIALAGFYLRTAEGSTPLNQRALSVATLEKAHKRRFQLVRAGCNLKSLDNPQSCHLDRKYQLLVIGNSHEPDGYNIFSKVYQDNPQVNLISFGTTNRCRVEIEHGVPVSHVNFRRCAERVAHLADPAFVSRLDAVIFSANRPFDSDRRSDWSILKSLKSLRPDLPIVVIGGYLNTYRDCSEIINHFGSVEQCRSPEQVEYNPVNERKRRFNPTVSGGVDYLYIDKAALLCPAGTLQSCAIRAGKTPAFYDVHHLNFGFARMVGKRIASAYGPQLVEAGLPPLTAEAGGGT